MSTELVFDALGDSTRRQILGLLSEHGPATATSLSADLHISRQAVAKHLDLLRAAGLTDVERVGREARHRLVPARFDEATQWLDARTAAWNGRVGRLQAELERRRDG